jgi:hypothetical protein
MPLIYSFGRHLRTTNGDGGEVPVGGILGGCLNSGGFH